MIKSDIHLGRGVVPSPAARAAPQSTMTSFVLGWLIGCRNKSRARDHSVPDGVIRGGVRKIRGFAKKPLFFLLHSAQSRVIAKKGRERERNGFVSQLKVGLERVKMGADPTVDMSLTTAGARQRSGEPG